MTQLSLIHRWTLTDSENERLLLENDDSLQDKFSQHLNHNVKQTKKKYHHDEIPFRKILVNTGQNKYHRN